MTTCRSVDLTSALSANSVQGHAADFPVVLQPVWYQGADGPKDVPTRRAVVRTDTGQAIAVVSNRYVVVPHTQILDVVERECQEFRV